MEHIITILMERDGMDRVNALELVNDTATLIFEAQEDGGDPEEVLADMLGLEPDYLDEFLF